MGQAGVSLMIFPYGAKMGLGWPSGQNTNRHDIRPP